MGLNPTYKLYPKAKTFKSSYRIVLKQEKIKIGTYKIPKEMFDIIKSDIQKYKSLGIPCKKVRCIETGDIFKNAREASRWLTNIKEQFYNKYNPDHIKQCCRGKQKTSYGYHWEFINEEIERVKERLNKKYGYQ